MIERFEEMIVYFSYKSWISDWFVKQNIFLISLHTDYTITLESRIVNRMIDRTQIWYLNNSGTNT